MAGSTAILVWLALACRVHRDARRLVRDPFLVFLATLFVFVPLVGPLVYFRLQASDDRRGAHA